MWAQWIFLCVFVLAGGWVLVIVMGLREDSRKRRRLANKDREALEPLQQDVAALEEHVADIQLQVAGDGPRSLKERSDRSDHLPTLRSGSFCHTFRAVPRRLMQGVGVGAALAGIFMASLALIRRRARNQHLVWSAADHTLSS